MRGLPTHLLAARPRLNLAAAARPHALLATTSSRRLGMSIRGMASNSTATERQQTKPLKEDGAGESGNPELPKFSLDGLGVSRNMKVFLVVVLSIFGTMETWFYCKAIWRWWYGEQGLAVAAAEDKK